MNMIFPICPSSHHSLCPRGGRADGGGVAVVEATLDPGAGLPGGVDHPPGLRGVAAQRLLAEDMLAPLQGGHGYGGVEVRRRADQHRLHFLGFDHVLPALRGAAAVLLCQALRRLGVAVRHQQQAVAVGEPQGGCAAVSLKARAHDGRSHSSLLAWTGTTRRRVYRSDDDRSRIWEGMDRQSSQTALINRPLRPSDSSEARKTARATASGSVGLPLRRCRYASWSASVPAASPAWRMDSVRRVNTGPGAMAFTCTLRSATSLATLSVKRMMAALEAA